MLLKFIFTFAIACAATVGYAQDRMTSFEVYPASCCACNNYNFFKMGVGYETNGSGGFGPAIGIGKRFINGANGVEISFQWAGSKRHWSAAYPKVMYVHYFKPESWESFYVGGGVSYGSVFAHHNFRGILAEGSFGYEFDRDTQYRKFIEFNISQGVQALGSRRHVSGPALTLAAGLGF